LLTDISNSTGLADEELYAGEEVDGGDIYRSP